MKQKMKRNGWQCSKVLLPYQVDSHSNFEVVHRSYDDVDGDDDAWYIQREKVYNYRSTFSHLILWAPVLTHVSESLLNHKNE